MFFEIDAIESNNGSSDLEPSNVPPSNRKKSVLSFEPFIDTWRKINEVSKIKTRCNFWNKAEHYILFMFSPTYAMLL